MPEDVQAPTPDHPTLDDAALARHLTAWLGEWPPADGEITVIGSPRRDEPSWDGTVQPLLGVVTTNSAVVSVPLTRVDAARAVVDGHGVGDLRTLRADLAVAVGRPGGLVINGIFRWTVHPNRLPDAGVWLPADDPVVPRWLHPFGGEVLVVVEDGAYVAGVGLKRHDPTGWEISVGTEEAARGRGLARRLVCQAARRVVEMGAVVTYLHAPDNHASAHVADASGFPDLGWRILAMA